MSKSETVAFWYGRLPHWEVVDGRYWITIHLAGAIPQEASRRIREMSRELRDFESSEYLRKERKVFGEMEKWLDRATDRQELRNPEIAEMIDEAIAHREQNNVWTVYDQVLMPNHLHMYLKFDEGRLKRSMEDFKRWTGHRAAEIIELPDGSFWQREWFDHWARSPEEGDAIMAYIRNNPVKAGLVQDYRDWPYGSWKQVRQ
jgi:REP element-mobilizing transposase RayT